MNIPPIGLRRSLLQFSLLGVIVVSLLACTSEASTPADPTSPPQTTPTAPSPTIPPTTAVSTPTPAVVVSPTKQPEPQAGNPMVDKIVAAVAAKDSSALAALVAYESLACSTAAGLGGPPACLPGETPGSIVRVLFTSSCDGHYVRPAEVPALTGRFLEDQGKLAGVYRHNGKLFPASQYIAVFSFETPYGSLARVLFISDSGIVGVTFACGSSAREYIEFHALKDPVLLGGG